MVIKIGKNDKTANSFFLSRLYLGKILFVPLWKEKNVRFKGLSQQETGHIN